jgi:hypothetical protein
MDKQEQYDVLMQVCNDRNLNNCKLLMNELTILVDAISDRIMEISHEEQILLNHHRNTLVNARVYSIHNHKISFKFLDHDDKMIKKYKVTKDEFWKLDREIIVGSLDEFLTPLR